MPCTFTEEQRLLDSGVTVVAGVDEAGRGCLAGPVVAAAIILNPNAIPAGLDDSKKLNASTRERLHSALVDQDGCIAYAVGIVDANTIDRINILEASREAMRQAVTSLIPQPAHVLIDGLPVPDFPLPATALAGGDGLSLSIAAASIIAKVTRDRMMVDYDKQFPGYGFARHKGYATREHRDSLRHHGPCPIHRRSFAPVAQLTFDLG